MSDDPDQLSLRLCAVLERIGVSESMRKMYHDVSIFEEIMTTIANSMTDRVVSTYIFGSSFEGTTTPSMGSDLDSVWCLEKFPVIANLREANPGCAFLMVTDNNKPGYVKLQFVYNGTPLTIHNHDIDATDLQYDCKGRVCLKHITCLGEITRFDERNGPADSISANPDLTPVDIVLALRYRSFSHIASESLNKCSACGWISEDDVERMKRFGILLVGVGHHTSEECDLEWRISFSFQERQLMLALNPTQHKCYVLLKIVKNIITAHPDVGKALTSYHCKTCLFTVITETTPALWTEENLIQCTLICLSTLKSWMYRGHCPNFFIKQNNMFEKREFVEVRERLLYYLRDIIHEGPMMFYRIESDQIGEALHGRAERLIDENRTTQMLNTLFRMCNVIFACQKTVLVYCNMLPSNEHIMPHLYKQLRYLTSLDTITEHTQEQTQMAVRRLEPVIHRLCAQHLASMAFSTEDPASHHRLLETSARHLSLGRNFDIMSGNLLDATILYREGNLESCRRLLIQIERTLMYGTVVSFCKCNMKQLFSNYYLERKIASGIINQQNIIESAAAPCMMFLPSQSEIIPKALQYEMYRYVYASPESRDKDGHQWYDFAVVDSKIYLHFLQYLVYVGMKQNIGKCYAIEQICQVMLQDQNLGHRDTGYNLLSWISIQEGWIHEAVGFLCESWKIRPDHNAAKWHMIELFRRASRQQ